MSIRSNVCNHLSHWLVTGYATQFHIDQTTIGFAECILNSTNEGVGEKCFHFSKCFDWTVITNARHSSSEWHEPWLPFFHVFVFLHSKYNHRHHYHHHWRPISRAFCCYLSFDGVSLIIAWQSTATRVKKNVCKRFNALDQLQQIPIRQTLSVAWIRFLIPIDGCLTHVNPTSLSLFRSHYVSVSASKFQANTLASAESCTSQKWPWWTVAASTCNKPRRN